MSIGPNTNADIGLLSSNVILVCGEDRSFLKPFVGPNSHSFRCFEFWKCGDFTMILCGMGTGCVEPLMWEITRPKIVRKIILLGTAGKMPRANAKIGQVYAIREAWLAGTALDGERVALPTRPRWDGKIDLPSASSVSTDFFYGFAPRILGSNGYPFACGSLARLYQQHLDRGTQLVDMEVAAFYCFCEKFGDEGLEYLAIKGPSNELGADDQQIAETGAVISQCVDAARLLLGLR